MASPMDILTPSRVKGIVSRIKTPGSVMARHFGFDLNGKNVTPAPVGARTYTYDIFDNTRSIARGRMPDAPANAIAKNPVGNNTVAIARSAEKVVMNCAILDNLREIGKDAGNLDKRGAKYVDMQAKYLRQRVDNFREFFAGMLFRGGVGYFIKDGDDLIPTYTESGSFFGIDLKVPAGNKLIGDSYADGLQMGTGGNLINGTWATASTDIPSQLMAINDAFIAQVGSPMTDVYVDGQTWLYVLQNTYVRQLAGSVNKAFAQYEMTADTAPDGTKTGLIEGRIIGMDWVKWHIYAGVIETGTAGTSTRASPSSYATFTIDKDAGDWLLGVDGSETVMDHDGADAVMREGFYSWVMKFANPARYEMHGLQNFGIELNVPKGIATARVR